LSSQGRTVHQGGHQETKAGCVVLPKKKKKKKRGKKFKELKRRKGQSKIRRN